MKWPGMLIVAMLGIVPWGNHECEAALAEDAGVEGSATVDFGRVFGDEPVIREATLQNVTGVDVVLAGSRTSCSCFKVEVNEGAVVAPGSKFVVKVTLRPKGYSGEQRKTATIEFDRGSADVFLKAQLVKDAYLSPSFMMIELSERETEFEEVCHLVLEGHGVDLVEAPEVSVGSSAGTEAVVQGSFESKGALHFPIHIRGSLRLGRTHLDGAVEVSVQNWVREARLSLPVHVERDADIRVSPSVLLLRGPTGSVRLHVTSVLPLSEMSASILPSEFGRIDIREGVVELAASGKHKSAQIMIRHPASGSFATVPVFRLE